MTYIKSSGIPVYIVSGTDWNSTSWKLILYVDSK